MHQSIPLALKLLAERDIAQLRPYASLSLIATLGIGVPVAVTKLGHFRQERALWKLADKLTEHRGELTLQLVKQMSLFFRRLPNDAPTREDVIAFGRYLASIESNLSDDARMFAFQMRQGEGSARRSIEALFQAVRVYHFERTDADFDACLRVLARSIGTGHVGTLNTADRALMARDVAKSSALLLLVCVQAADLGLRIAERKPEALIEALFLASVGVAALGVYVGVGQRSSVQKPPA